MTGIEEMQKTEGMVPGERGGATCFCFPSLGQCGDEPSWVFCVFSSWLCQPFCHWADHSSFAGRNRLIQVPGAFLLVACEPSVVCLCATVFVHCEKQQPIDWYRNVERS